MGYPGPQYRRGNPRQLPYLVSTCGRLIALCFCVLFLQLGGYTLLHVTMGNVSVHSSDIVGLLLQFGADPNSGGMRVEQEYAMNGIPEEEMAREVEHMNMVSGEKRKLFLSGENEGGIKVTPLHSLCSVQIKSGEDRDEVSIKDRI